MEILALGMDDVQMKEDGYGVNCGNHDSSTGFGCGCDIEHYGDDGGCGCDD